MLQAVLRRQSLFKLRDRINGKVSKSICEIEGRKQSPYRFSNSPLRRKLKDGLSSSAVMKRPSPVRVPSIFCKKLIDQTPSDLVKRKQIDSSVTVSSHEVPKLPIESPLIVRAATQYYKKISRCGSIKRTELSSIADTSMENSQTSIKPSENMSESRPNKSNASFTGRTQQSNSPTGRHLILSTKLKCSTESIDL